ncbi:MAG: guanylate kinase [Blautia sp.]|nr:guanylate kinase [Blautia sp.]
MGKIFYIMGKSAAGKDKIYSRIVSNEELSLKKMILYTTRPIRAEEKNGREYFFTDDSELKKMELQGRVIERREYDTVHGIWTYFTADDGQVDLEKSDYLGIGTLESFVKLRKYYGEESVIPIYIQVENGERLTRALLREKSQDRPRYAEMCRRFLADEEDFSEENIQKAGIVKRFENTDLDICVEEIVKYIKSVQ